MTDKTPAPASAPALCTLCGEPMPEGETMFFFHGYSGPCPKPALANPAAPQEETDVEGLLIRLEGRYLVAEALLAAVKDATASAYLRDEADFFRSVHAALRSTREELQRVFARCRVEDERANVAEARVREGRSALASLREQMAGLHQSIDGLEYKDLGISYNSGIDDSLSLIDQAIARTIQKEEGSE